MFRSLARFLGLALSMVLLAFLPALAHNVLAPVAPQSFLATSANPTVGDLEMRYRQAAKRLLAGSPSPHQLERARDILEHLQTLELHRFLGETSPTATPKQIEAIDPKAAVFYPFLLDDRLSVIVSVPGRDLISYETILPQGETEAAFLDFLQSLHPFFDPKEQMRLSQQLYDWLIRPVEAQLSQTHVQTLVFVLDGMMRNLPMAALHDGDRYLVEKYAIALTPGLQLLDDRDPAPVPVSALAAGLTEARQGFEGLPAVAAEVEQIRDRVPSRILLDRDFTTFNIGDRLVREPFSVVHLATHGQFSSNLDDTFLLTWDGRINIRELARLLRSGELSHSQPVELLVLSACQTAAGDNRAALGLAGMAVRSGARSTLATLWSVNDRSTAEFASAFYQALGDAGTSKAEALRQAQLYLLRDGGYQHPFYWAPFVLVGNWQ